MPAVARYTRFVALSKRFLWVLVGLMIGVVVWIASDKGGDHGARIVFSGIQKSVSLQNIMTKPHYQGVDRRNRPYTIIAEKATQLDKDTVVLEAVRADMVLNNGGWIALNAGTGKLDLPNKHMELKAGVDIFYGDGYEFRTDHANIDIQKGSAYGDATVEGQGPLGTLTADSFSVSEHGQSIHFNGSVRMKLYR